MKPRLALFTEHYPFQGYGPEVSFLRLEMPALARNFRVSVIPFFAGGPNLDPHAEIDVDLSLAKSRERLRARRLQGIKRLFTSSMLYKEIAASVRAGAFPRVHVLASFALKCELAKEWFLCKDGAKEFDLVYTYWCTGVTAAAVRSSLNPVVSRLHRFDLYPDQWPGGYVPGLATTVSQLKLAICVSKHGTEHLASLGLDRARILLSYLGVASRNAPSDSSTDGALRITSCSFLRKVKRVGAIYEALAALCQERPHQKVHWTHIGDGEELSSLLQATSGPRAPSNLAADFRGRLTPDEITTYYRTNAVDLFLHASASEGLPVSILEAMSFGIPVASTNVGGIAEAITPDVGYLVHPDDPANGLKHAVEAFLGEPPSTRATLRRAAQTRQRALFDSERNFDAFASRLLDLSNASSGRA